jgi:hypothetical protein
VRRGTRIQRSVSEKERERERERERESERERERERIDRCDPYGLLLLAHLREPVRESE